MREEIKTITFSLSICLICSILLSGLASGLKSIQTANQEFDVKRNIVKAFGIDISKLSRMEIEDTYNSHISEEVVSTPSGDVPIYQWTETPDSMPTKYAFPISGKGLWSMMYGYLSIDSDLETVAGISFYKHGETPGLGAEIVKSWFSSQFSGKKLYADGKPTDFRVLKPGSVLDQSSVDGISGSTITSKGVEALIKRDAATYADYFNNIKGS
jgi:Na+-transporting NADH:ubiquinone oxidoreductase subunit C